MRQPPSNTRAIGRALRSLGESGRLDELDEALGVLAVCSAVLVDEALGQVRDMLAQANDDRAGPQMFRTVRDAISALQQPPRP